MTTPKLPGQVPSNEQEQLIQNAADHWRTVGNEAPVQAITRIEEAAKQLIGLTTLLQGIYFAIFAFSDVRKQVGALNLAIPNGLVLLLFFLPLLLWLISLYCATRVFVPQPRPEVNLNDIDTDACSIVQWRHPSTPFLAPLLKTYTKEIMGAENPYGEKLTARFGIKRKAKIAR